MSITAYFSTPLHWNDENYPESGMLQARVRELWKDQHRWPGWSTKSGLPPSGGTGRVQKHKRVAKPLMVELSLIMGMTRTNILLGEDMAHSAPGKHYREGLSFIEVADMFPDNLTAERWFVQTRWPNGVCCPACGSLNVQPRPKRKPQPFRCRERACLNDFSVKTTICKIVERIGHRPLVRCSRCNDLIGRARAQARAGHQGTRHRR